MSIANSKFEISEGPLRAASTSGAEEALSQASPGVGSPAFGSAPDFGSAPSFVKSTTEGREGPFLIPLGQAAATLGPTVEEGRRLIKLSGRSKGRGAGAYITRPAFEELKEQLDRESKGGALFAGGQQRANHWERVERLIDGAITERIGRLEEAIRKMTNDEGQMTKEIRMTKS